MSLAKSNKQKVSVYKPARAKKKKKKVEETKERFFNTTTPDPMYKVCIKTRYSNTSPQENTAYK